MTASARTVILDAMLRDARKASMSSSDVLSSWCVRAAPHAGCKISNMQNSPLSLALLLAYLAHARSAERTETPECRC